jgi:hypothetical protein
VPAGRKGRPAVYVNCVVDKQPSLAFPHGWWQPGQHEPAPHFRPIFIIFGKFLLRCSQMPSRTNLPNIYVKSLGLTLMVQKLFYEKPFLVLRCTSKNHKSFPLQNVLFLHISAIVFY